MAERTALMADLPDASIRGDLSPLETARALPEQTLLASIRILQGALTYWADAMVVWRRYGMDVRADMAAAKLAELSARHAAYCLTYEDRFGEIPVGDGELAARRAVFHG